jgi:hypothetical protein
MPCCAASSTGSERAQASAELALALPFVSLLLLLVVQVAAIARAQSTVDQAAREGGRLAAVGADAQTVVGAVAAGGLAPERTVVEVQTSGDGFVTVIVRTRQPTDVPVVGLLVPDVQLEGRATFRQEGR